MYFFIQRKNPCRKKEPEGIEVDNNNCPGSHHHLNLMDTGSCMMNETPPNSAESYCSFVEQVRKKLVGTGSIPLLFFLPSLHRKFLFPFLTPSHPLFLSSHSLSSTLPFFATSFHAVSYNTHIHIPTCSVLLFVLFLLLSLPSSHSLPRSHSHSHPFSIFPSLQSNRNPTQQQQHQQHETTVELVNAVSSIEGAAPSEVPGSHYSVSFHPAASNPAASGGVSTAAAFNDVHASNVMIGPENIDVCWNSILAEADLEFANPVNYSCQVVQHESSNSTCHCDECIVGNLMTNFIP